MKKYQIALADDHSLIRKGLVELINSFDNYEVLFHVGNGVEFLEQLTTGPLPQIAMLDVNMPKKDGYATASWLQTHHPDIPVLALSMYNEESAIIRMLKSGAKGYIFKDADPRELRAALDSIMEKGFHYSELITGRLIHNLNRNDGDKAEFSPRELEFFRQLCTESSYKEIAEKMHLSARTLEGYRDALCERLQLRSRVGLVLFALKRGLVDLQDIRLDHAE